MHSTAGRRLILKNLNGSPGWLTNRTVYLTVGGSRSYGTAMQNSDTDYRGIAVAPIGSYVGILNSFEQFESKDPDLTIFCMRKFVRLASAANPNILEMLFTESSDHISCGKHNDAIGRSLIDMRDLFVTKRAMGSFSGYALSQMKKIRHNTEHSIPGSARHDRIQRFGYCTKNAMHLVRLLRMAREILETGQVLVRRPDAAELLEIRNGKWSLAELVEYAEQMDHELTGVAERSSLPSEPDMKEIDRLCVSIMRDALECL